MNINGYKVEWREYGWSWMKPTVYEKRKIPFLPLSKWVKVWEGESVGVSNAEQMLPDLTLSKFQNAVYQYEEYSRSWEKYFGKKDT